MNAHTGGFPTYPKLSSLLANIFVLIFIIIEITLFVLGCRKGNETNL